MIQDLEQVSPGAELNCDIAIVGAGAVGLTMAAELSRRGADVLLLEGGGTTLETASQALMQADSTGYPLDGLKNARYRVLGGATNFWGGQLVRFDANVFEPRPWIGSPGWPIDRQTLEPYYGRCDRLLGLPEGMEDAALWRRLGVTPPDFGPDLKLFLTRWLRNPNLAQVFHADLAGPALRVLTHANVVRLERGEAPDRITGLQVKSLAGRTASVRAARVVLAGGTVEILKLLLQPLADDAVAPWASNPWLGRGFLDHPDCYVGRVRPLDRKAFHQLFDNLYVDRFKYNPKLKLTPRAQAELGTVGASCHLVFNSAYGEHLDNLKIFARSILNGRWPSNLVRLPAHLAALSGVFLPLAVRYLRSNRAFNPSDRGIDLSLVAEQRPNPASRVTALSELDPVGMRKVAVDWLLDGSELETIAQVAERVRAALLRLGLADVALDPLLATRDPAFMTKVHDSYHQMGGARMSATASDGVVDPDLKVHGADGLFVAGAAVYPASGYGNPTLTAMALGLRLCDHLLGATP